MTKDDDVQDHDVVNRIEQIDLESSEFDQETKDRHVARYEWARKTIRERLGRKPTAVIDFASGTGYGSRILHQDALVVLGRDRHAPSVQKAQDRYRGFPRLWFKVSGEEGIGPHADDDPQFDAFVCIETIEHLEDPRGLLSRALRLLRPGGVLILTTPVRSEDGKFRSKFHKFELSTDQAAGMVHDAGFADIIVHLEQPGFTYASARRPV